MGFWATAGAAFVGALGVAIVLGLARLLWLMLHNRYTGMGQFETEVGRMLDREAGEIAKRMRAGELGDQGRE
jgi:hypothetical protein